MPIEHVLRSASISASRILDRALSNQGHLTVPEAAYLLRVRSGEDVAAVSAVADHLRRAAPCADDVTFVINRNINFTNACIKRCGFCAFSRTGTNTEAYYLPTAEIVRRVKEAHAFGATEVCVQAGLPMRDEYGQAFTGKAYLDLTAAIKAATPTMHVHGFSPEEVRHGASTMQVSIEDFVGALRDAGVGSLPGTSAEILDDNVRKRLGGNRLSVDQWRHVITSAHKAGLRTTCTMMYGHLETPEHVAAHLHTIREIQSQTKGFTEFVPLSFVSAEAPIFRDERKRKALGIRAGPTGREVVLTHAVSRIMLAGHIDSIQVSWPKEGLRMAQHLLQCGVNDLGGVLMNESISTAAGAAHGQMVTPATLRDLIWDVDRVAVQRNTTYTERLCVFEKVISDEDRDRTSSGDDGKGKSEDMDHHAEYDEVSKRLNTADLGSYHQLIGRREWRARDAWNVGVRKQIRNYSTAPALSSGRRGRKLNCSNDNQQPRVITYSPSHTIVPTYECFNKCSYCNFRRNVSAWTPPDSHNNSAQHLSNHNPYDDHPGWISLDTVATILDSLDTSGAQQVREILVLSGEVHPSSNPLRRQAWFKRIKEICTLALSKGFLPHTNAGPLSMAEMEGLAEVNASMGLMVEQVTPKLRQFNRKHHGVHARAPSKDPQLRLEQLEQAGVLRIPFTTGLLLGIGEDGKDRIDTLESIAKIHSKYGHIQEVILQPHSVGDRQEFARDENWSVENLPELIAAARAMLPPEVHLQIPPNLVAWSDKTERPLLRDCLDAGASDLGGISPLDEVNPSYAFPPVTELGRLLETWGFDLQARSPVHNDFVHWMRPQPFAAAAAQAEAHHCVR